MKNKKLSEEELKHVFNTFKQTRELTRNEQEVIDHVLAKRGLALLGMSMESIYTDDFNNDLCKQEAKQLQKNMRRLIQEVRRFTCNDKNKTE